MATPGHRYFTLVRTEAGNASADRGKLVGQLGGRFPTSCYSPDWCIFPVDSEFLIDAGTMRS